MNAKNFGPNFRIARKKAGLNQKEATAKAGLAGATLSLIETGHRDPKLATVVALAVALGCSVDALLADLPPDPLTEVSK